jgi:acetyl-CoA synthetase
VAGNAADPLQGGRAIQETYYSKWDTSTYFVGDAARKDEDGYFWILGRVDDVVNVSGHRLSTAEVESAIVSTRRSPRRP